MAHKSQITTWMSRLPQTAYGTARTSGSDWRRILSSDQTTFDSVGDPENQDDASYDNGTDIAEDVWAITNDSGVTIPFDFNFQDIGYHLYDTLGGYSVSTLATGVYQHIFTPQNANTSRQLPARTYLKKYGDLKTVMIPDGVTTALSISGAKTGRLTCSKTVKGSGDYSENPAGYTEPTLESDREFAYAQQARFRLDKASVGTAQVETATIAGTITGTGTVIITVTSAVNATLAAGKAIAVTVTNTDTASVVAGKVRLALQSDPDVNAYFTVSGSTTAVILTARIKAANDTTLNIASTNGTATGLTPAATSANTTAGVVGETHNPECKIQTWSLNLNTPEADSGYNVCSRFLTAYDPKTGAIRSEYLFGSRDFTFEYEIWLAANDPARAWMKANQNLAISIPIVGILIPSTNYFYSLTIDHTKARLTSTPDIVSGDFIGGRATARLLSSSGSIPLTCTLVNTTPSYAS